MCEHGDNDASIFASNVKRMLTPTSLVGNDTNDGLIAFRVRYINDIELWVHFPLEHEQYERKMAGKSLSEIFYEKE